MASAGLVRSAGDAVAGGAAAGDPHATTKMTTAHKSPEIRLAISRDINMSYASVWPGGFGNLRGNPNR